MPKCCLWFLGLLLMLGVGLAAAAPPAPPEQSFREMMRIDPEAVVEYLAADGTAIDYAEFFSRTLAGESFGIARDEAGKRATVRLGATTSEPVRGGRHMALKPGDAMPAWNLDALDGDALVGPSGSGRPVLFSFFFAACTPCIREVPMLNAFIGRRPEIALAAVTFDERTDAAEFVARHKLAWPVYYGAQSFIDAAGVDIYPTFALVAGDGRLIAAAGSGEIFGTAEPSAERLQAWVDGLLPRPLLR